jgi:alkylation response protein AidB-like acyl-CoA dehydrogenase
MNYNYEFDLDQICEKDHDTCSNEASGEVGVTVRDDIGVATAARQVPADREVMPLRDLVAEIAERRDEFDRLSHVPRDVIESMKRAGIFRAATPRRFGGDARPPAEFLRMIEAIAVADGSTAWVAALPLETQRAIYADGPDQVYAGGLYPLQPARPVEGGVRATGRWRFASGCMAADWIGVGISVDTPLLKSQAQSTTYMAVCPANEVEIIENWDVVGMQGTGSHDTRVQDKFYPLEWICARGSVGLVDEPLYRYPSLSYQAEVHAAVNIGLARAALDTATEMAGGAKIMPGAPKLADRAYYRSELARGESKWRSARAFFYESSERAWDVLLAGNPIKPELENLLRLSATHAAHASAEVVQQAYRIAGMAAIHKSHRLQRLLRDSLVVTQHASLSEGTYEAAGAIFTGVMPGMPYP